MDGLTYGWTDNHISKNIFSINRISNEVTSLATLLLSLEVALTMVCKAVFCIRPNSYTASYGYNDLYALHLWVLHALVHLHNISP